MLEVCIQENEYWDEEKEEFINCPYTILKLEHSLKAIDKWESIWKKPFVSDKPLTTEEFISYIECMTLNNVNPIIYSFVNKEIIKRVDNYIGDPMTATTFSKKNQNDMNAGNKRMPVTTSEIVYYWMIRYGIPFDCEYWNFNKLMTLIRVCSIKEAEENKNSQGLGNHKHMPGHKPKRPRG